VAGISWSWAVTFPLNATWDGLLFLNR